MDLRVELRIAEEKRLGERRFGISNTLMMQDNAIAEALEEAIEALKEKLKINKLAINNKLKKMKFEAIAKADEQRNAKKGNQK